MQGPRYFIPGEIHGLIGSVLGCGRKGNSTITNGLPRVQDFVRWCSDSSRRSVILSWEEMAAFGGPADRLIDRLAGWKTAMNRGRAALTIGA
jgi:hypothetical protein